MLGIIKRNFEHITRNCFVTLYKSLVKSHLEYANSVWYSKSKMDVDKLERVQKRSTKLIPELCMQLSVSGFSPEQQSGADLGGGVTSHPRGAAA